MLALQTDLYELTMAAGFFAAGKTHEIATFELFVRRFPRNRNILIAAGLPQAVDYLLGLSFTPQHSDARVLDQVVYKWHHSRRIITQVLAEKYADLKQTGWSPSRAEIERDVKDLFGGAFERFCGK